MRPTFDEAIHRELIAMGRARCRNQIDAREIDALRAKSSLIYDSLYPGHGPPSATTFALSAAGEVAFTDSALEAAVSASEFAAAAIAENAALRASEEDSHGEFTRNHIATDIGWQIG